MSDTISAAEQVHNALRENSNRYVDDHRLGWFARGAVYDPANPVCNYDTRTWWPAHPGKKSKWLGPTLISKLNGIHRFRFEEEFVEPLTDRSDELLTALSQYPVMFINSHARDLQAALPAVAAPLAVADVGKYRKKEYQANLERMIRLSHGIATRALAPLELGYPRLKMSISLMDLAGLVINTHTPIPRIKSTRDANIPEDFIRTYNAKVKADCVAIATAPPDPESGLHTLWTMSPNATKDRLVKEAAPEKVLVANHVEQATTDFIRRMHCGIMVVRTSFKGKNVRVEYGEIIPPEAVSAGVIHDAMEAQAKFRRDNGEGHVYYGHWPGATNSGDSTV